MQTNETCAHWWKCMKRMKSYKYIYIYIYIYIYENHLKQIKYKCESMWKTKQKKINKQHNANHEHT